MSDKKVSAEIKRLMALFEGVDENKIDFIREHVRQLAWYNVRIRELQQSINEKGMTIPFQNGRNQSGLQANPDIRTLIDLQKLTNAIVKVLLPLVPEKQSDDNWSANFLDCDYGINWEERRREDEERERRVQAEIARGIELQRKQREQANSNHV